MNKQNQREHIAIVGIGCRMPGGATSAHEFWETLLRGEDVVGEVPPERWDVEAFYDPNPDKAGKIKTRRGGFIENIDQFDNEFFNIFPKEAERLDPQQRILLMLAYEALEDAGEPLATFRGSKTAVFVGHFMADYWDMQVDITNRYSLSPHVAMGSSITSLANRISYLFDLRGPSITLDTACSSSLVSVHLACHAIWQGEADTAMAGGVNIMINPISTLMMSKGGFLSPDGACKAFDIRANGYVRSEGAGLVYLKPLSKAINDGNSIYGVIRGSACNSDGFTPEGFTVPSEMAQTRMLLDAYADAGISPDAVQYVEAHSTGTPVGDPIETKAFGNVFGKRKDKLMIGSVKTNVGHLEGAAGITGLIKMCLCLKHKRIPGNLHFTEVNPKIDLEGWRLKVVDQTTEWPQPANALRVGGVNSFGAGGTNAHLVVEEAPQATLRPDSSPDTLHLFVLSAATEDSLKLQAAAFIPYLSDTTALLADICLSAGLVKSWLTHRLAIVAASTSDLVEKLQIFLKGEAHTCIISGILPDLEPKLCFVFTGQGPQWYGMGRELLTNNATFRAVFNEIERIFVGLSGWSLEAEMLKGEANSRVSDTRIAQPAIMAIQVGLVEIWKQYGIDPAGVVGHSVGEVAGAFAAGALTLEQAVAVIYHRSRGQHAASGKGKMLAVGVALNRAQELITPYGGKVSIGAVNGPAMITLSGDEAPLKEIANQLTSEDVFNTFLMVNVPFHSYHMDPLKDELLASLADIKPSKTHLPMYSTVTGQRATGDDLNNSYWYKNVREPVYFAPAVEAMLEDGYNLFVELGPHPALSSGTEETFVAHQSRAKIYPSLRRKEPELARVLQTLGALYVRGTAMNWPKIFLGATRCDLPRYVWDLKRFWYETQAHANWRLAKMAHPLVKAHVAAASSKDQHKFELLLDRHCDPYFDDHRVNDVIIFPATGHLETATAAATKAFGDSFGFLEDVAFESGLFLPEQGEHLPVRLEVFSDENRYVISSQNGELWTPHSRGKMNTLGDAFVSRAITLSSAQARVTERLPIQPIYNELKQAGLFYGPTFKTIEALFTAKSELLARIDIHESIRYGLDLYHLHPAILDACLHVIFAARFADDAGDRGFYLPVRLDRYKSFKKQVGNKVWSHVNVLEASAAYLIGDFTVFDEDGSVIAELQGLHCKYIEGSREQEDDVAYSGCFEYSWVDIPDLNLKTAPTTVLLVPEIGPAASCSAELKSVIASIGTDIIELHAEGADAWCSTLANMKITHPKLGRFVVPCYDLAQVDATAQRLADIFRAVMINELQPSIWLLAEEGLNAAPLRGFARVLVNEYPQAIVKIAYVSPHSVREMDTFARILASTSNAGNETEIRFTNGNLQALRLNKVSREHEQTRAKTKITAEGSYYEAYFSEPTIIDSIAYRHIGPAQLRPKDVEISVKAAALNFKDVLNGMGLLTSESVAGGLVGSQLGLECSGVVTRVGDGVTHVKPGMEVIAIAPRSLAGVCVTPDHCVALKPSNLSHVQSAALTIVYLTAYHCLVDVGRLEKGEKVLIHSATGGVGLAAIQIAQHIGAEIYATAGSEEKRDVLRKLGIKHVYNSRSLNFYDDVMRDTQGRGVDVVLNSLSGKAIVQSMKCLARFGRFVEIGKTDLYEDASIHLKRFGENLSYSAVDVDRLMAQRPEKGRRLFANVVSLIESGAVGALPVEAYPMSRLAEALGRMSKGKHVGKIVVSTEGDELVAEAADRISLTSDGVYVVTGGASGFGIELAKWLVERGARSLSVASRSGPKSDNDRLWFKKMREEGITVRDDRIDLTDADAVRAWLAVLESDFGKVNGVVHSAAVLKDVTVQNFNKETFRLVYDAKATSAGCICEALADKSPDFILMLSSISSVFGLPGQFNYSAANNYLDGLAEHWSTLGLNVKSANLGVLGSFAGMSKDADAVMAVLNSQGWLALSLPQVKAKLEQLLLDKSVVRMTANVDLIRFREFFHHLRSDQKFAHLLTDEALNLTSSKIAGDSIKEKLETLAEGEAQAQLLALVASALARILGTSGDKVAQDKPLSSMGLDSLMMNQLRNWIQQKLEINYPLMKMLKGPTLSEMSGHLLADLRKAQVAVSLDAEVDQDMEFLHGWFMHRKQEQPASHKLIMFHSMGAAASMFGYFLYEQPADCDVYAVQLPGRENRSAETPYVALPKLLDDLEIALLPLIEDGNFSIYGHSFGGIIAFEMVRRLRRKGKSPKHLFCSATMAPQITLTWKNRDVMRESTISANSEQKLLGLMSYIDDVEFVKQILPLMRRDMSLLMSYDYVDEAPLDCPITVFSALEDEVTLPDEMAAWSAQTTKTFKQEMVHGDHWFVSRNKEFIGAQIDKSLAKRLS